MQIKRIVLSAAVLLLAAALILALRYAAAKRETTQEMPAGTTAAQEQTAEADDAPADESVRFPSFSFTRKDDKVFATVMGGDGQTAFNAEEYTAPDSLPTAGEIVVE